jgi:hypothetical protein
MSPLVQVQSKRTTQSVLKQLGLARTGGFLPQRWNCRSGRLFLGCAYEGWKKRYVLTFSSRSGAVSVCATQARGICSVTTCFTTIPLHVAWRTYNYRLTRARGIVACAFGILCNKLRIFHRATDVYPDFCDVVVITCCIQLRSSERLLSVSGYFYTKCPLESIKAVGTRGHVTGTDMGRRAQGTCISPWGPRWGSLAGGSSTGDLCVEEGSGDGHLSP